MHAPLTYGHRLKNTRHPVRSAKDKLQIGWIVVASVTSSEVQLLYVFAFCFSLILMVVGDEVKASLPELLRELNSI